MVSLRVIALSVVLALAAACAQAQAQATPTPAPSPTPTPTPIPAAAIAQPGQAEPAPEPTQAGDPEPTPTPSQSFLSYYHPSESWRISYPPGWQVRGPSWDYRSSVEKVSFDRQERPESFGAHVGVTRLAGWGVTDLKAWSQGVIDGKRGRGFRLLKWEESSIAHAPAYETVFFEQVGGLAFAQVQLHLVLGEDGYIISAATTQKAWNRARALLTEIVYSFQPFQPAARVAPPTSAPADFDPFGGTESVTLAYAAGDSTFVVERRNGELWLLEGNPDCPSLPGYEGRAIQAQLGSVATTVVTSEGPGCELLTKSQMERVQLITFDGGEMFAVHRPNGQTWRLLTSGFCFGVYGGTAVMADFGFVTTTLFVPGRPPCETQTDKEIR